MTQGTKISWTDETWNPVTGCTKVSAGCKNCYAEGVANRFWGGRKFTDVRVHPERLDAPLRWRKPRRVFVNSMSDLFHDDVSDAFIARVFTVMALAPRHTFQILTKRPERMHAWFTMQGDSPAAFIEEAWKGGDWTAVPMPGAVTWPLPNVWLGVSCEDQKAADERIPLLLQTPAAMRFLSCEPLLGPIDLERRLRPSKTLHLRADVAGMLRNKAFRGLTDESGRALSAAQAEQRLRGMLADGVRFFRVGACDTFDPASGCPGHAIPGLDWIIAGGESGPGFRPMQLDWAQSLRDQCRAACVPFFFKQIAATRSEQGTDALGEVVREFP